MLASISVASVSAEETLTEEEMIHPFSSQIDLSEDFDETCIIVYVYCTTYCTVDDFPEIDVNSVELLIEGCNHNVYQVNLNNTGEQAVVDAITALDDRRGYNSLPDEEVKFVSVRTKSESTPLGVFTSQIDLVNELNMVSCINDGFFRFSFWGESETYFSEESFPELAEYDLTLDLYGYGWCEFTLHNPTYESLPVIMEILERIEPRAGVDITGVNLYWPAFLDEESAAVDSGDNKKENVIDATELESEAPEVTTDAVDVTPPTWYIVVGIVVAAIAAVAACIVIVVKRRKV